MWTCPKCGRVFQRAGQSHFCGEKPENVDAYINSFDADTRAALTKVRESIRSELPEAVDHFAAELDANGLAYSKGTIRIPYNESLPLDLIRRIARWCRETGYHA